MFLQLSVPFSGKKMQAILHTRGLLRNKAEGKILTDGTEIFPVVLKAITL